MKPNRVIIAVEGGGQTGGAERVAFDSVKILSDAGIPVVILSSASEIDATFMDLPGVEGVALDLNTNVDRYFAGGKKGMVLNLLEDSAMRKQFAKILPALDSPHTILHAHGFHNYFTQALFRVANGLQMKTILTCHDYGLSCPNSMQFDYEKSSICLLDPLSRECRQAKCMGEPGHRVKTLRFGRSWASEKLFRAPQHLDLALCVSDFQRSVLERHFGNQVRLKTLCSPVYPASADQQTPSQASDFLWIGRMTAEKDAVTPAKICREEGFQLTIVGDGPQLDEVRAVNPDATYLGWISPSEVRSAQCRSRALILSSKCYETASLVVLECLAAGIPCIVPSISAATSWVEDNVNGLIYDIDHPDSMKDALSRMQDDDFVARLGKSAYDRYWQAPFTAERHRDELLQHYSEVLSR